MIEQSRKEIAYILNEYRGRKRNIRSLAVLALWEHGTLSTIGIKTYINENSKHGTTMPELGNVLGKDSVFVRVCQERIGSTAGPENGTYTVYLWKLSDVFRRRLPMNN